MYANSQYRPAAQQWTAIDPTLTQHFASNKLTQTRNGSQTLETQQAMKPGISGKLSNIVHRVEERFTGNANSRWTAFGVQEPLLQEFPAKTSFAETRIGGWIFISQNHFGWISYTDSQNRVIKTLIPWSNVTNIVPTSRVRGQSTSTKSYQFSPIMAPGTAAEGFQIFTRDNLIYQFFGLKKNIEQVFALFNNVWTHQYGNTTSGLHQGGFVRNMNQGQVYGQTGLNTGFAQPAYGQTGLNTGLAQPAYGQTGLNTGLAQPAYGQTGLNTGLAQPAQYGTTSYQTTTYAQPGMNAGLAQPAYGQTTTYMGATPATYGQTGLAHHTTGFAQPGYAQTGMHSGVTPANYGTGLAQPGYGQTGLAGQALQQQNILAKEGFVQPTTGMALGQTAPTNYRGL